MSGDTDLLEQLKQFGLSESEAAVYLVLVDRGRAKPSELASETDLSTSYVYKLSDDLEQKGLAVVEDHQTPTTIRAAPPEESLGARMDDMENALSTVKQRFTQPTTNTGSLETIRSRETATKRLRRLIEQTESELLLSIPYKTTIEVADALRDAVDRGVFVLLSIGADEDEIGAIDLAGIATAVHQNVRGIGIHLVADTNRGLVASSTVFQWEHVDSEAISFSHPHFAATVEGFFLGNIWPPSEEVMLEYPRAEPRTYQSMRSAVYNATVRFRAGRTVRAEVIALPTLIEEVAGGSDMDSDSWDNRPERALSGTVVETRQNLVEPYTSDFPLENTMVIETSDGRVTVGGEGAFIEDYAAEEITIFDE